MIKQSAGAGTVVGSNVKLQGTLKDIESIVIHGQLEGELSSEQSILIAENAQVKGPVSGEVVTVAGTVKGSIEAKSKLEILPTGRVNGSVVTKELIVQAGAVINGKVAMVEGKNDKNDLATKDLYGLSIKEDGKTIPKGSQKVETELEYELE